MGRAVGARVVGAASSEEKLELARDAGADATFVYPRDMTDVTAQKQLTSDLLELATSSRSVTIGQINSVRNAAGFDVVYDGVGGGYAEAAARALAWEGRYLSVGFAAGVPKLSIGPLLFKNATLHGIQPSEPETRHPARIADAVSQMFAWYEEGKLRPRITETWPLEQAQKGFRQLLDRKAMGRVVVTMT